MSEIGGNPLAIKSGDIFPKREKELLYKISTLEEKVKELESDLKLNASMLAKQCDLAREAESRLKKLQEAVDKHKDYMWGDGIVDHSADKELYRTKNEI